MQVGKRNAARWLRPEYQIYIYLLKMKIEKLSEHPIFMAADLLAQLVNQISTYRQTLQDKEVNKLAERLKEHDFWWIDQEGQPKSMLYDNVSGRLWRAKNVEGNFSSQEEAKEALSTRFPIGAPPWRLPSSDEIFSFAQRKTNPLRKGSNDRLLDKDYWLTDNGVVDLDSCQFAKTKIAWLLPCIVPANSKQEFILIAQQQGWKMYPSSVTSDSDLIKSLNSISLQTAYKDIDYQTCRLPELESAQFTDPNKGLWELWGATKEQLENEGIRARNPADDVRDWNITIDFGTSSTVVAYDDNGRHQLLRIGVSDFYLAPKAEHYENPTVLEFLDFQAMLQAWQSVAYRPQVSWDNVRCSHEAMHNLRNNETKPDVVASILGKIKQWALRQDSDRPLRITDLKKFEHELESLKQSNPVMGEALAVGNDYPFDPVELYAWFLGMNINWRGRGLFLRYFMTFPVAYPRDVKENILASFRRGLQRSLPPALVAQPIFNQFEVTELASEPVAYAAAALPILGIPATAEGQAYAVFDFGGGTADFDFGYYRLPNAEEEDSGCELVFEQFGNEGDRFLGGENLLENLAYLTFQHNLEKVCRPKKIPFTRPLDAKDFPGSELFLENTQAAATNTLMLISRLRPLWEKGALSNNSGIEKIHLLDRNGEKILCELAIPVEKLEEYLKNRIEAGIQNFFVAMKNAFSDQLPHRIDVLLAGNASRSLLVSGFFGLLNEDDLMSMFNESLFDRTLDYLAPLFGEVTPSIVVHPPLPIDEDNLYQPTAKTGVALGLLKLCPGGAIDIINHARKNSGDQAPFAHYVGRIRQQVFHHSLPPGVAYGEWHEVGIPRDRVFNLFYTQSPKAQTGTMQEGEPGLFKKRLDLAGDLTGKRVFVRAIAPALLEYCTAASREAIEQGQRENLNSLQLG